MCNFTADGIETLLKHLGLPLWKFNAQVISEDLKKRTAQNETLSALLTSEKIESVYFDPIWQKCRTR